MDIFTTMSMENVVFFFFFLPKTNNRSIRVVYYALSGYS